MERDELRELHYIVPIANLSSIARYGILSHAWAERMTPDHESVADASVQARRADTRLPSGRALHEYANLYVEARTTMLAHLWDNGKHRVCVLRIDPRVVDVPGAYVSSENAARNRARFEPAPDGLAMVQQSTDLTDFTMAEVLVPAWVPPWLVTGAYAHDSGTAGQVREAWSLAVTVNGVIFHGRK